MIILMCTCALMHSYVCNKAFCQHIHHVQYCPAISSTVFMYSNQLTLAHCCCTEINVGLWLSGITYIFHHGSHGL